MRSFWGKLSAFAICFGTLVLFAQAAAQADDTAEPANLAGPAYAQTASLEPTTPNCMSSASRLLEGCELDSGNADSAAIAVPPSSTPECDARCGLTADKDSEAADAIESCRPWNMCGGIEEQISVAKLNVEDLPATSSNVPAVSVPAADLAAVDDIVDRMVRDYKANSTPQSSFAVRTLGYRVPKGNIVILTSERRLLYFFQDSIALEFMIGTARRGLQRLGQTQVVLKRRDPIWVPTALQHRVYRNLPSSVGPGPKNPLGTRALNLTIPNIRIHGTNDEKSIGGALSDGCFHMHNRDIEFLFEHVAVGAKVTILR
jgi:lipoprotein-anchoring transpeptidase ErfK/SrfK